MNVKAVTYEIGNIADWLSAIGTVGALLFAIYLATKDTRTKLEITVINNELRARFNGRSGKNSYNYEICIVNIRPKTVHLQSMSIYTKNGLKKKNIFKQFSSEGPIMTTLLYGEIKSIPITLFKDVVKDQYNNPSKLYVCFEDITGKKFKKKFNLS